MTNQHDSKELVNLDQLDGVRDLCVGVVASAPFWHYGLSTQHVDVSRETIQLRTASYGRSYPAQEVRERVCEMIRLTVVELDVVIKELTRHRDRLIDQVLKQGQREDWVTHDPTLGPDDRPTCRRKIDS